MASSSVSAASAASSRSPAAMALRNRAPSSAVTEASPVTTTSSTSPSSTSEASSRAAASPADHARLGLKVRHTRTREGCDPCKKHRVRCDMHKPSCLRCERTQRQCVYNPPKAKIFQPTAVAASPSDAAAVVPAPLPRPGATRQGSIAFQYYVDNVAVANNPVGEKVPYFEVTKQVAVAETAYMHIINAYSTLDRAFWHPDDGSTATFYYQSIQAGVEALRARTQLYHDEMTVLCCANLSHLEMCRTGDASHGLPHVNAALEVAADWEHQPEWPIESRHMRETLCKGMLIGMATARIIYHYLGVGDGHQIWTARKQPSFIANFANWRIPERFRSVAEAAEELSELHKFWIIPLARRQRPTFVEFVHPSRALHILQDWETPYHLLPENITTLSLADQAMQKLLWAHYLVARMCVVCTARAWSMASVRAHDRDMRSILNIMSDLTAHHADLVRRGALAAYDSNSFIFPLFFVATCSAHAYPQERALQLLQDLDVREGAWHSRVAWHIADAVVREQRQATSPTAPFWVAARCDCRFLPGPSQVELVVTLHDIRNTRREMYPKVLVTGQDALVCRAMKWPMHGIVRSWGYFLRDLLPTPLFQSAHHIRNKLMYR